MERAKEREQKQGERERERTKGNSLGGYGNKRHVLTALSFTPLFQNLAQELLKKLDSELKYEVVKWTAYYVCAMSCFTLIVFIL